MIEQCPACDGADATEVIELRAVPAFCNVLYDTAEEARQAPRGDLRLVMCPTCGLLYNAAFDASLRARDPQWGIRDMEHVVEVATASGFAVPDVHPMPANNFSVVFRRA